MKKLKTFLKKLLITSILIIILCAFAGVFTTSFSKANELNNSSELKYEYLILKKEYEKLTLKLIEMESNITKIQMLDNSMYAQLLGVNFDTLGYQKYFNDTISFILRSNESIFSEVNDRAFYAAEMLATRLTKLQETSNFFKNKNVINYYPTISPIKIKDFICLSSPFGFRDHPIIGEFLFHEGVDISARVGTKVYSSAQGKIVAIMYSKYGYGNRIVVQHAYGFETLYAHLGDIYVKKGQYIKKNQLIGTVGNTGLSTGPHLHYEIHKNGEPRDPLGYFFIDIGKELIANK